MNMFIQRKTFVTQISLLFCTLFYTGYTAANPFNGSYEMECTDQASYHVRLKAGIGEVTHSPKKVMLTGKSFDEKVEVPINCQDNTLLPRIEAVTEKVLDACQAFIERPENDLAWVDCNAVAGNISDSVARSILTSQNNLVDQADLYVIESRSWLLRLLGLKRVYYNGLSEGGTPFSGTNMYIDNEGNWFVGSLAINGGGLGLNGTGAFCTGPTLSFAKGYINTSNDGNEISGNFTDVKNFTCGAIINGAYLAGFSISTEFKVEQTAMSQ